MSRYKPRIEFLTPAVDAYFFLYKLPCVMNMILWRKIIIYNKKVLLFKAEMIMRTVGIVVQLTAAILRQLLHEMFSLLRKVPLYLHVGNSGVLVGSCVGGARCGLRMRKLNFLRSDNGSNVAEAAKGSTVGIRADVYTRLVWLNAQSEHCCSFKYKDDF